MKLNPLLELNFKRRLYVVFSYAIKGLNEIKTEKVLEWRHTAQYRGMRKTSSKEEASPYEY